MTKGKHVNKDSEEVARLKAELAKTIKKERTEMKVKYANQILSEYQSDYDHAKTVFFKVNGARRILKNA